MMIHTQASDAAAAHLKKQGTKSIYVKAWDQVIHYTPLTPAEQDQAEALAGPKAGRLRLATALIVVKARNEEGKPLYGRSQFERLYTESDANVSFLVYSHLTTTDEQEITEKKPETPEASSAS